MSPESLTIIVIVSTIATILIVAIATAAFFHWSLAGMKRDLQHETNRIWKRVDDMTVAHQTLSDKVNQLIGSTGVAVKESGES